MKAIFSNDVDLDLTEGSLRTFIGPAQRNATRFDEQAEATIAAELQPRLLQYRLANYGAVERSDFDASAFTTAVRDLAQSLAASVAGDPDLAAAVVPLLAQQDEEARARWTTLPEFAIVVVVLAMVHERKESKLLVKKLSELVNATLHLSGEITEFSPEEVGHKLTALGLFRGRTAGGMVIRITHEISRQVHDLKRLYGITTSPAILPGCPDCESRK